MTIFRENLEVPEIRVF